jgi:hypothetical protein
LHLLAGAKLAILLSAWCFLRAIWHVISCNLVLITRI